VGRELAKRDAHIDRVVLDTSSSGNTSAGCIERDVASSEVPIGYNPRLVDEGKKIRWTDGIDAIYISW